ncbi:MAG: cytochrome P460 family protein [Planctomycetota bacterium]|jgi:hypothetical protein
MPRTRQILLILFAAPLLVASSGCGREERTTDGQSEAGGQVAFPEGYQNWTHVKSMVILEGHQHFEAFGGFHHVYANDRALAALKEGKAFSKGSILVFDLRQALIENNAITEGPRLVAGVMEKDPDRFPDTEGWGFEDFKIKEGTVERAVTNAREQCLSCHASQEKSDYVYSKYRR